MSKIPIENKNDVITVHSQLKILQQTISAAGTESHAGGSYRPPYSIMGAHNEQSNLSSINQYGD